MPNLSLCFAYAYVRSYNVKHYDETIFYRLIFFLKIKVKFHDSTSSLKLNESLD